MDREAEPAPTAVAADKKSGTGGSDPNLRFRYIGFEVFPKKEKPFFASDEEKKLYLHRVEEKRKQEIDEEREFSLLFVKSFTRVDKVVLFLSAAILIFELALPWFYLPTGRGFETFFGFALFGVLAPQLGTSWAIGWNAGAGILLMLLNLVAAPLLGLLLLFALLRKKSDREAWLSALKKVLRLNWIPILGYLLIFGFSAVGFRADESPLPIFKEGFNIFDLISGAGPGFWLVLVGHLLPAVKSADL